MVIWNNFLRFPTRNILDSGESIDEVFGGDKLDSGKNEINSILTYDTYK